MPFSRLTGIGGQKSRMSGMLSIFTDPRISLARLRGYGVKESPATFGLGGYAGGFGGGKVATGGAGGASVEWYPPSQFVPDPIDIQRRYGKGLEAWEEAEALYAPEGALTKGLYAQLERQKELDVAASIQQMVTSGLYPTTVTAGLPTMWEEEIGVPARLQIEEARTRELAALQAGKAGYIAGFPLPQKEYKPSKLYS